MLGGSGQVAVVLGNSRLDRLAFHFSQVGGIGERDGFSGTDKEVGGTDYILLGQDHCFLDGMLQFAYVARPIVTFQFGSCLRVDGQARLIIQGRILFQEVVDEKGNIFPAVPERRYLYLYGVDAIVEILPEKRLLHQFR